MKNQSFIDLLAGHPQLCAQLKLVLHTEKKKKEPELTPQDIKGRRTAIITGFISIGFGV